MPSVRMLQDQRNKLENQLEELDKKISEANDDPYGILEFISKTRYALTTSGKTIEKTCKRAYYHFQADENSGWFFMECHPSVLNEVVCLELTSFLAREKLFIYNILKDNDQQLRVQIADKKRINEHIADWGK